MNNTIKHYSVRFGSKTRFNNIILEVFILLKCLVNLFLISFEPSQERMLSPEDVIGPVNFLLSKTSSAVNGSDLYVDGGYATW